MRAPRPPESENLNIIFNCYHHGRVLNNYPKFHPSAYAGNRIISDFHILSSPCKRKKILAPGPHKWDFKIISRLLLS